MTIIATIAGFPISLEQVPPRPNSARGPSYTVRYGQQVRTGLDYYDAARELGLCVMHALAADGSIILEG